MENREVRAFRSEKLELRASEAGGMPTIQGYAAVYDKWSEPLPGPGGMFRERIRKGAFDSAVSRGDDVRALWNHDPSQILGRVKSNTLKIEADDHGLRVSITPPDTNLGRDMVESIGRGDVDSMSFAFETVEDHWNSDLTERELRDVVVYDVSPVSYPAYQDTEVAVRSMNARKAGKPADGPDQATRDRIAIYEQMKEKHSIT